jgi:hypothetical protein
LLWVGGSFTYAIGYSLQASHYYPDGIEPLFLTSPLSVTFFIVRSASNCDTLFSVRRKRRGKGERVYSGE